MVLYPYLCIMIQDGKTIAAVATGSGGAIAIIRLSGLEAFSIADRFFKPKNGVKPSQMPSFTVSYGDFVASDGEVVDDILLSKFVSPHSYTGEDTVEFSVHASEYVKGRVLQELIGAGARVAEPGEYTLRAYVNGKMDMVEAEAVADIIASDSRAGHMLALSQMRGGYGTEFSALRRELIELQSLLELELDFSEEDVEFADRGRIVELLDKVDVKLTTLIDSYWQGSAIKEGVPVAIIGAPNAGKSTLLNVMLNEERAIVSSIPGTTRDSIEETIRLGDVLFRFIDTAGMRPTDDPLETIGIERAKEKARNARVILLLVDAYELVSLSGLKAKDMADVLCDSLDSLLSDIEPLEEAKIVILLNKCDKLDEPLSDEFIRQLHTCLSSVCRVGGLGSECDKIMAVSAKNRDGVGHLNSYLASLFSDNVTSESVLITSARHLEQLSLAHEAIESARKSIENNLTSDLVSAELRAALYHVGLLTGEITDREVLENIFSRFCIGK